MRDCPACQDVHIADIVCDLCLTQELIIYAIICICDVGSLALCIVLALVSLYYLILYKMQVGWSHISVCCRAAQAVNYAGVNIV